MDIKYNPNKVKSVGNNVKIILTNILYDVGHIVKLISDDSGIPIDEIVLIDDRYVDGCAIKSKVIEKLVKNGMKIVNSAVYDMDINKFESMDLDIVNRYPIVCNINRISEKTLSKIYHTHSSSPKIWVVLDPHVSSPEYDNYQEDYILRFHMELSRGSYYSSIDRDLIYLVNKLRIKKNKILSTESIMVQYRNINFDKTKYITAPDYKDSDNLYVVPRVHYNAVTSKSRNNAGVYHPRISPGDDYHLLNSITLKHNGKNYIVPAGSKISVTGIHSVSYQTIPKYATVYCNIETPESHAYSGTSIDNCMLPLNYSMLLLHYDSSYFEINPEYDEFDMPAEVHTVGMDVLRSPLAVEVAPYNVIQPWMTKYRYSEKTTVYIQDYVASLNIMCEELYFNNVVCISSLLDIKYSFKFEPLPL